MWTFADIYGITLLQWLQINLKKKKVCTKYQTFSIYFPELPLHLLEIYDGVTFEEPKFQKDPNFLPSSQGTPPDLYQDNLSLL